MKQTYTFDTELQEESDVILSNVVISELPDSVKLHRA